MWDGSGINDTPALTLVQDLLPPTEPPIVSKQNCRVQICMVKLHQHHFSLFFALSLFLLKIQKFRFHVSSSWCSCFLAVGSPSGRSNVILRGPAWVPTVLQLGSSSLWPGGSEEQQAVLPLDYGGTLTRLERWREVGSRRDDQEPSGWSPKN